MLLYCVEINKGASAAPVVRAQPLFIGTRCELYTSIRYEWHLCYEYRAGLEAGRYNRGMDVGMRDLEKALKCQLAHKTKFCFTEGAPSTQMIFLYV